MKKHQQHFDSTCRMLRGDFRIHTGNASVEMADKSLEIWQVSRSFKDKVSRVCKPDHYNCVLNWHMGDIFIQLSLLPQFKQVYPGEWHFIIRPGHECLMEMFGIDNYSTVDFSEIFALADGMSERDAWEKDIFSVIFCCVPNKNDAFVFSANAFGVHDCYIGNCRMYHGNLFGVATSKMPLVIKKMPVSDSLAAKIRGIAPIEKICLFAPESQAIKVKGKKREIEAFWQQLAAEMISRGYSIVVNAHFDNVCIPGTVNLDLTLAELIELGTWCHSVHSVRSGLCDVLAFRGKDLYVYNNFARYTDFFNINSYWELPSEVNEIITFGKKSKIRLIATLLSEKLSCLYYKYIAR